MKTEISVKIDFAKENDLIEILNLQKEAYLQEAKIYNNFEIQPLRQTVDSLKTEWENGVVLKATSNGIIIGSVRGQLTDRVCKIGKLIVKPEFQNKGIGKLLMKEIEEKFCQAKIFELFTGHKSEKNLALYKKLGYKEYERETISDNLHLVYLRKAGK